MKAWLSQNRVAFEELDLLARPPARDELGRYAQAVPGGARNMVTTNTGSEDYRRHLAGKELSDDALLDLLAKVPNLLRKPILTDGQRILQGVDDPARLEDFVGTAFRSS